MDVRDEVGDLDCEYIISTTLGWGCADWTGKWSGVWPGVASGPEWRHLETWDK